MEYDGWGDEQPGGEEEPGLPLAAIPLHSTNLLTVLDDDGTIRYESPSIERIYGYEGSELVGDAVAEYFHPDDRSRVVEAFRRVVDSEEYSVEAVEYRHLKADGTYVWVESVAAANPTPQGYYVVNTREISARRRREQELERANERLETFATALSHDLRNPLEVANAGVALAQEDCESEHLTTIARANERMADLIEDVLTAAMGGDRSIQPTSVTLSDFVESCWQTVPSSDATLQVKTEMTIRADEPHLRQLLENLFRNAIEHGGPDVTITVGTVDGDSGFYVADDGPGIPADERPHVFKPGYSSATGELGLGLAIVTTVVEAHDWTIEVTTSRDGGARFEITDVDPA